jgi:DNA-directed RNA polymerase subunit RPC12/RpoP|tara:strand:+ start:10464 stop:10856 length:393 start_codon:yes stop_codon:yes gene_type:complete
MDKEQLKDLLKQFSQEEIREALGNEKKKNRRRGKGKRKKTSNKKRPQDNVENKFDDMISTIRLSADEEKELREAGKADEGAEINPNRGKRGSAEKQSFRCASCGRDYKMFPSQIYNRERWKCNRCITGGK